MARPTAPDATWTGSWDESFGARDGLCESFQVVAADANSATLVIETKNGAKFRVTLQIEDKRVKSVSVVQIRTANGKGAKMQLSNFKVLAESVRARDFSVTFSCDRKQGETNERYEVTIKARRGK